MGQSKSQTKELAVGDLVTHVLYGKEWGGRDLDFKTDDGPLHARNEKALIQIQPGTRFENFFKTKVAPENKINDNLGYVTTNWLFKIEVKNGKVRPSRNKAPKSGREN